MFNHKITGMILTGTLAACLSVSAFASTSHFNDSSVTGADTGWEDWTKEWPAVAADFEKVSITVGADQTQLNFAWYSKAQDDAKVFFGEDKDNLQEFDGESGEVGKELTGDEQYYFNHVTVTGLEASKTYYYTVQKDGEQTEPAEFKTQAFDSVKMLYVGDPQVGASKGQPTANSEELAEESGEANTAAENDGFAWNRTLNIALGENPDINYIISAGDQVNHTGNPKEEEFAAYLNAEKLSGIAQATTIGNHDSLNPDYGYHFFNPNQTDEGKTEAGGDYYYSYGPGLFIVLNTNNYNVAEHADTIKKAVEAYPDAKWRIVTIHQDIYGSGLDHSNTDGMILRTQLTPVFDENDIDVVLQGHDHTYSRTKILKGDGAEHGKYEFRLNEAGDDYDWQHAYNVDTDEAVTLYAEDGTDMTDDEKAGLDAFTEDNKCYTISDVDGNSVDDPDGILYMTANSATGSKYYELAETQQDYVAVRSQNWLPSYSVISLTDSAFSIDTYQIKDDGTTEKIDDTFTINKTSGETADAAAATEAQQ